MNYNELKELLVTEDVCARVKAQEDEIFELIPEFRVCKGFDQKNSWHVYDVYEHILHVVAGVEADLTLRLVAFFHDIGKPPAFTLDEAGVGHFWGHWDQSKAIFDTYADRLGLAADEATLISTLIFYHDINIDILPNDQLCEMVERIGREHIKKLFAIKRADLLAQSPRYHGLLENIQKQEEAILKAFA